MQSIGLQDLLCKGAVLGDNNSQAVQIIRFSQLTKVSSFIISL